MKNHPDKDKMYTYFVFIILYASQKSISQIVDKGIKRPILGNTKFTLHKKKLGTPIIFLLTDTNIFETHRYIFLVCLCMFMITEKKLYLFVTE